MRWKVRHAINFFASHQLPFSVRELGCIFGSLGTNLAAGQWSQLDTETSLGFIFDRPVRASRFDRSYIGQCLDCMAAVEHLFFSCFAWAYVTEWRPPKIGRRCDFYPARRRRFKERRYWIAAGNSGKTQAAQPMARLIKDHVCSALNTIDFDFKKLNSSTDLRILCITPVSVCLQ